MLKGRHTLKYYLYTVSNDRSGATGLKYTYTHTYTLTTLVVESELADLWEESRCVILE